jgi:two-component system, OmpR family, sensor histidine kinase KdpD
MNLAVPGGANDAERGERLTFCVSDQGPGIPAEYRDQIFEKFFPIKTGRPRTPGTGPALPICKGIVEAHGDLGRDQRG